MECKICFCLMGDLNKHGYYHYLQNPITRYSKWSQILKEIRPWFWLCYRCGSVIEHRANAESHLEDHKKKDAAWEASRDLC